jgi:signal transduction histidine kinase
MKPLIALYFFILALIQAGLLLGIYNYYRPQNSVRVSKYWMISLLVSILALLIFGAGVLTIDDVSRPQFNFTVANSLFIVAAIFQGFFCISLTRSISSREFTFAGVGFLIFFASFEALRRDGSFESRTIFMAALASMLYIWQILAIRKKRKLEPSIQLQYLQYVSSAELFFAISRAIILSVQSFAIRDVGQLPQLLIFFTIFQLVMNTLSYIAIGGYWSERISRSNLRSEIENKEIKDLLQERESLINSLLKANKTVATGALSASIAHELNQPLGATQLNIQFLQKKLADGELNPLVQKEVLETLLADNQRAANIIGSLRSIFADEKLAPEEVKFSELINSITGIVRPELQMKQIRLQLDFDQNLVLLIHRNELQQVLLNLINNAILALSKKFIEDKCIVIAGKYTEDGVEVSVSDNGPGISDESRAHLFELLSASTHQGMGLGLWLCKHIIQRHGGKIWYESEFSSSTTFVFTLPSSPLI